MHQSSWVLGKLSKDTQYVRHLAPANVAFVPSITWSDMLVIGYQF